MERINKLRHYVLTDLCISDQFHYLFFKKYAALTDLPEEARYAEAYYAAMTGLTPTISDGELIVGNRNYRMTAEEKRSGRRSIVPFAKRDLRRQVAGRIPICLSTMSWCSAAVFTASLHK